MLVVCHCFENSDAEFVLDIPAKKIKERFGAESVLLENNQIVIKSTGDFTGGAVLLEI